ncbi:50S ribosomal protein L19-1, chloroplastic-like [Nymphaea colorata]|nr:50S ribosomal protein L19-1, chloroplastic-like [Nymphaea colorata]
MYSLRKNFWVTGKRLFNWCPRVSNSGPLNHRISSCENGAAAEFCRRISVRSNNSAFPLNDCSRRIMIEDTGINYVKQLLTAQAGRGFLSTCGVQYLELFRSGGLRFAEQCRLFSAAAQPVASVDDEPRAIPDLAPQIKFKRLDKTAKHIMQILDREAVEEVKGQRDIPDIKPGYIVQLKVEVPENKRRVSVLKGIVIARRNAGLNTTFRLRRLVAGVGVESVYPLYSPNIKEIKVLDKKKVRRAKLYYLRDKMNPLKK